MAHAECYIKGEESNAKKRARDVKEKGSSGSERKNYDVPPNREGILAPPRPRVGLIQGAASIASRIIYKPPKVPKYPYCLGAK